MGDSTSAESFGNIFEVLAKDIDKKPQLVQDDRRALAKRIYKLQERLDFSDDDMGVDDALLALGLAEKCRWCERPVTKGSERYHKKGEC